MDSDPQEKLLGNFYGLPVHMEEGNLGPQPRKKSTDPLIEAAIMAEMAEIEARPAKLIDAEAEVARLQMQELAAWAKANERWLADITSLPPLEAGATLKIPHVSTPMNPTASFEIPYKEGKSEFGLGPAVSSWRWPFLKLWSLIRRR